MPVDDVVHVQIWTLFRKRQKCRQRRGRKLLGDTSRGNKLADEAGGKVVQTVTSETPDREMTFSGPSRPENVPATVEGTTLCVGAEWLVDETRTRTKMPKLGKELKCK